MNVVYDYQAFCLQSYGGISRYYVRLIHELVEKNVDVSVCAPMHRNYYLNELPGNVVHGRNVGNYPPKTTRLITAFNHYLSRACVRKSKPDICHETYYKMFDRKKRNRLPTVVTVYDMIHEIYPNQFPARDKTSDWKRDAVNNSSHIIAISDNTKKDLIKYFGAEGKKISVVHLGVERFSGGEMVRLHSRPYILYAGMRHTYKNFANFLMAYSHSDKLSKEFDLVAFGGGGFSNEERCLINRLGLNERQVVQMSGGDNILASLYEYASAFVYPSLYEGFGMPPLEAMSHNCPVVSSRTSSMPEVIGDAAEYFNPNDNDSIANAIENVVFHDDRCIDLTEKGKQRVKMFTWDKCAQETLEVYKRLLA